MPKKTFDAIEDAPAKAYEEEKEPISGSTLIPATMHDIKQASKAFESRSKALEHKSKKQFQWGAVAAGIALIGSVGGGLMSVKAIAQDAGVQAADTLKTKHDLLAEDYALHKREESERHSRLEAKQDRIEVKLDLALDSLRVPMWKRPDASDGGR